MKMLLGFFTLCLVSTIIQDAEAANPADDLPLLTVVYDDSWTTPNDYYSVQLTLVNGEVDANRDQITMYLAASTHDGAGNLNMPITACGSDTPFPGQAVPNYNSISLNFVLQKSTGDLVTDNAILGLAPAATPAYISSGTTDHCGAVVDATVTNGLRLVIQTFESADTSTPGVYSVYWDFTIGESGGTLHSRSASLTKSTVSYLAPEYVTTPPLPPVSLTPPSIALSLDLLDATGGVIMYNGINLGDGFRLQLTATIDASVSGYKAGLDLAGVVVKECTVGTDTAVTTNTRTFIVNTCAVDTDIFASSDFGSGIGFTKFDSSLATDVKTYIARSHLLEAGGITPIPDLTTATHDLYFKCTVELTCYDDTTGPCSVGHCTSRKKRAVETDVYSGKKLAVDTDASSRKKKAVQTVVHKFRQRKFLPEDTFETALPKDSKTRTVRKTRPCSETLMFKATVGTLGSAVVILFFGVIFSYYDLKKSQRKAKMRRHGLDSSKMSGGSRTELMADNLSNASSEKNTKKC